jgi:hypothetical protein
MLPDAASRAEPHTSACSCAWGARCGRSESEPARTRAVARRAGPTADPQPTSRPPRARRPAMALARGGLAQRTARIDGSLGIAARTACSTGGPAWFSRVLETCHPSRCADGRANNVSDAAACRLAALPGFPGVGV